ncbi:dihydrofolate reductase family protein [Nocardia sp. NPDC006044]|uniref:dihydrofolate reductase family protein n=1 Tax=Nocardia sp. NPDC006044 TaxID=3364306 RepID=UPI00368797B6
MRLVATTFVMRSDPAARSLGCAEADRPFDHAFQLIPYGDDDIGKIITQNLMRAGAFLLGWRTFDAVSKNWQQIVQHNPVAAAYSQLPKYIVSTRPRDCAGATNINGDITDAVAELKERPGLELQVYGSTRLSRALMDLGLVDEYRLLIYPLSLCGAQPSSDLMMSPAGLPLSTVTTTSGGIVSLTYCEPRKTSGYSMAALRHPNLAVVG